MALRASFIHGLRGRVEFRVVQLGDDTTILAYGFNEKVVEDIRRVAVQYRNAIARQTDVTRIELRQELLDFHLAQDSFTDYLQHACPADVTHKDAEICRTHPKYFLWPRDRFFVRYRPQ